MVWEATAVLLIFPVDWGEEENNIVCLWSVQENRVEGNWCAHDAQSLRQITHDQMGKEEISLPLEISVGEVRENFQALREATIDHRGRSSQDLYSFLPS